MHTRNPCTDTGNGSINQPAGKVPLGLRLLRSRIGGMPELDAAEGELQQAIAELRRLAHGLYPVVLMDQGLAAALSALAESRHLHVASVPNERLPAVVESTAYLLIARA